MPHIFFCSNIKTGNIRSNLSRNFTSVNLTREYRSIHDGPSVKTIEVLIQFQLFTQTRYNWFKHKTYITNLQKQPHMSFLYSTIKTEKVGCNLSRNSSGTFDRRLRSAQSKLNRSHTGDQSLFKNIQLELIYSFCRHL